MKKTIFISAITLSLFGIIMIYSSSNLWASFKYNNPFKYVINQGIFFIIGLILMFIISKIDYNIYKKYSNKIILICIILLILVLIPGIGIVRNGSRSWFGIASFGIQPSEFTKLSLLIFTSKYLENNDIKKFKNLLPILLLLVGIFFLILLEPDFGTGTIIVMSVMGLLFVGGMNISFLIKLLILGVIAIVLLIIVAPYRLQRILSFLNPWQDPLGSGFQIIQSLYAIGPGGLLGMGFLNSIQKHFYLPEPQTDFIFAIISEEFGFMGVIVISILFLLIIYNGFKVSRKTSCLYGKYLSFGITFQLAFQTILNLMVVVGLVPITGVTLPFLSYGGSSLLVTMISVGILLNIAK